jgi:hypothetical protein
MSRHPTISHESGTLALLRSWYALQQGIHDKLLEPQNTAMTFSNLPESDYDVIFPGGDFQPVRGLRQIIYQLVREEHPFPGTVGPYVKQRYINCVQGYLTKINGPILNVTSEFQHGTHSESGFDKLVESLIAATENNSLLLCESQDEQDALFEKVAKFSEITAHSPTQDRYKKYHRRLSRVVNRIRDVGDISGDKAAAAVIESGASSLSEENAAILRKSATIEKVLWRTQNTNDILMEVVGGKGSSGDSFQIKGITADFTQKDIKEIIHAVSVPLTESATFSLKVKFTNMDISATNLDKNFCDVESIRLRNGKGEFKKNTARGSYSEEGKSFPLPQGFKFENTSLTVGLNPNSALNSEGNISITALLENATKLNGR